MAEYVKELRELLGTQPIIVVGSTVIVRNAEDEVLFQLRSDTKEWGYQEELWSLVKV